MNYKVRRNGDAASGVGAGSPEYLSTDWRTAGMLGKRENVGACDAGTKGVVTGDETTPTRKPKQSNSPFPTFGYFDRDAAAAPFLPTIPSKSGDRDVARSDLVAADEVNDRRRLSEVEKLSV